MNSVKPSRETVAEAAAWITRLHSSRRSPEVEAVFRSWLAADREHARAFEGMTEIWDTMPAMRTGELRATPDWRVFTPPRLPRLWIPAAAAIAGVCVVATLLAYGFFRDPSYTTNIGEQRIVNLDDGTRVSLNSGTRVTVAFGEAERRIELEEGEAFFEVAHDPRLPFVVEAGGNRVTALGTSFAVRYDHQRTAVTLVDGSVTVAPASASKVAVDQPVAAVRRLKPGERWVLATDRSEKIDTPRLEAVTAWRRGEVILDETVLADALAEMNRYGKTPLVIDDPAIAALPVSGIYRTGDGPGFARIVARMYGLTVSQENGRILLKGQPKSLP